MRRGFDLVSLYLVSLVVLYFTWHARSIVSTRGKNLPVQVVVHEILGELFKLRSLERGRVGQERGDRLWRGFHFRPP